MFPYELNFCFTTMLNQNKASSNSFCATDQKPNISPITLTYKNTQAFILAVTEVWTALVSSKEPTEMTSESSLKTDL